MELHLQLREQGCLRCLKARDCNAQKLRNRGWSINRIVGSGFITIKLMRAIRVKKDAAPAVIELKWGDIAEVLVAEVYCSTSYLKVD